MDKDKLLIELGQYEGKKLSGIEYIRIENMISLLRYLTRDKENE